MTSIVHPQAFWSTYAPRLRAYNNSLVVPVPATSANTGGPRTTKRGTTIINYAEDGYDYDDEDDNRRRPTGLRNLQRDDGTPNLDAADRQKTATDPVVMQGVHRDWMEKKRTSKAESDLAKYVQSSLPLTLIPIRLDIDIPSFVPLPPIVPPVGTYYDTNHPAYKPQEPGTVASRLKDTFLWNLHEALITTDQFAEMMVQDLDIKMPARTVVAQEISKQIRTQLEEYAGVALHPLFHSQPQQQTTQPEINRVVPLRARDSMTPIPALARSDTPMRSHNNLPLTPSKLGPGTPQPASTTQQPEATATATAITPESDDFNPDDTYRCIVTLSINQGAQVYVDKFEWSLLHPPGTAEAFARQTCSDIGLCGEWIPAITHAIYEAVLKLKKEACEAGGLVAGFGGGAPADFPNDAAISAAGEGAGWRYEPEQLASAWEPKVEFLSIEEIEKREGDRERQLRRLRRETARFSSNTGMVGGVPIGFGFGGLIEQEEERMGRGERSKKKRRFRSLSPLRGGTPGGGGRGTPDVGGGAAGGYGGGGSLTDAERLSWRCAHCLVWGTNVWAVRDGPQGPRSLCNNCGFMLERDRKLPRGSKNMHINEMPPSA